METRVLGRTGLEVGILGMGGSGYHDMRQEGLVRIVDRAEEVGANCFDLYWHCEGRVGRAMRGRRKKFVLMTKVEINAKQLEGFPEEKRDAKSQIEESLCRLGTDYIDVCQLHYVVDDEAFDRLSADGTLCQMLEAQREGKVRFLGITSHSPRILARAIKTGHFATLMVPFNVVRRQYGQDASLGLFQLAQPLDVGVIIMKPVSYGRIQSNIPRALQFIWSHPVSVVIPGATSLAQWNLDIAAAAQYSGMTVAERDRCLDESWLFQGDDYCTGCRYCLPCPSGMNIPELMRVEQYTRVFGLTEWLSEERVGKLFVDMSRCDECGICEERCPMNVPIRERLPYCADLRQGR